MQTVANGAPKLLRYSERKLWAEGDESLRSVLERLARTREVAQTVEARVAELEAALEQIANYQPGRLGYEGPRDMARLALKGQDAD